MADPHGVRQVQQAAVLLIRGEKKLLRCCFIFAPTAVSPSLLPPSLPWRPHAGGLQGSPGAACEVWVTFLSGPALARMHETEGGYECVSLAGPPACLLQDDGTATAEGKGGRGLLAGGAWPSNEELLAYVCR
jgi:hypothetical protein